MALGFATIMAALGGTAAGAAAAKTGIFAAIKAFLVKNGAAVATTASAAAIALSGNTFEGKRKSVTFGKSDVIPIGKHHLRVPQVKVRNIRASKDASSRSNRVSNVNHSRQSSDKSRFYHSSGNNLSAHRKR